jgi:hypothetical protein
MSRSQTIREDLERGKHVLHCELLQETKDPGQRHEFRLISLMRCVPSCSAFAELTYKVCEAWVREARSSM